MLLTLHLDQLQLPHPSLRGSAMLRSQLFSNYQFVPHQPSIAQVQAACLQALLMDLVLHRAVPINAKASLTSQRWSSWIELQL